MNRRVFSRWLAFGAATPIVAAVDADAAPGETEPKPAQPPVDAPPTAPPAASGNPVCVADFRLIAQSKLPKPTFDFVETGSADEITLRENVAAFQRLRLLPPILSGVARADLSTTVLGTPIELPIMLAPVAAQRMYHAQGALASARAATACGTVFGVSSSAANSVEEIAAASDGPKWYQLYLPKDREIARNLVRRVERSGYKAIVVTVDLGEWKDADRRNRFALPREMLLKHLTDVGFTGLDRLSYDDLIAFNAGAWDLTFDWSIFDFLRAHIKLPLVIKGVLRPDDARRAVERKLDGIIVSNHGGRRLDGVPAGITMLPHVVEAVGGRAEVFVDGGVRRGTDVLKALALGARAVLIGRPYIWGLAADGEAGVRGVLDMLRDELQSAMTAAGCRDVGSVPRSLIMS